MNAEKNREIRQQRLTGERALFGGQNLKIYDTIFADGESPLKESRDIELYGSMFQWKYPLWYAKNIYAKDCSWLEMGRAGVWYTEDITVEYSLIEAPKNFRRCRRAECGGDTLELRWSGTGGCDGEGRLFCHEQPEHSDSEFPSGRQLLF